VHFPDPPTEGRLLRRYKRFLADAELPDGSLLTAHCPNTGSLLGCLEPGSPVWLRDSLNPARKLRYTWQAIQVGEHWVNVDTGHPNRVVAEAVAARRIRALRGYRDVLREVPYGERSRIDLLLTKATGERCYVEVKNTTLVEGRRALFPDAVTERGRKHLGELAHMVREGHRALMFFFVSRRDATRFGPADSIDPAYGRALREAVEAGVEVLAYRARVEPQELDIDRALRVELPSL